MAAIVCPNPPGGEFFDIENQSAQPENEIDERICSICRDSLSSVFEGNYSLSCSSGVSHTFHEKCIKEWVNSSPGKTCPCCRAGIKQEDREALRLRGLVHEVRYIAGIITGLFVFGGGAAMAFGVKEYEKNDTINPLMVVGAVYLGFSVFFCCCCFTSSGIRQRRVAPA
jgi:hypothetical protein